MQEPGTAQPEGGVFRCYRHPNEETRIRCARCERPICPNCMIAAPVGYHCPECVAEARREFKSSDRFRARMFSGTMTRALIAVIAGVFVVEVVKSHGDGLTLGLSVTSFRFAKTLFDMGAAVPYLIAHGQWWRLITAMFLHLSLLHIAFNAYALWLLGSLIEPSFGRVRLLVIFLVTGFIGNVASFLFSNAGGVGASGAVFGLLGALVAFNLRRRRSALAQAQLRWAAMLLLINTFLALGVSQIDWRAHLGGFVAGLAMGAILEGSGSARAARLAVQVGGTIALVAVGALLAAGHTVPFTG